MTYSRDSTQFLLDILDSINDIEEFIKGIEFDKFSSDKKTVYAVLKALEIIGEAAKNIPDLERRTPRSSMEIYGRNP